MKATRQVQSLCLVIGMTIISCAVIISFAVAKGSSSTFADLPAFKYQSKDSGSGNKSLSTHYNRTTSLCIGNTSMFHKKTSDILISVRQDIIHDIAS
jgi:hypothetical protein